jgi:ABC-type phosphate/phosphonate transport system substrate-binding protein
LGQFTISARFVPLPKPLKSFDPMIASLPMYDLPEIRWATDALWEALAQRLDVELPLTRGTDWRAPWRSPDLLFSQTCGYPFTHEFAGQLTYVATPHYDADGCEGPNYRSILFAREKAELESFRGRIAAINGPDSMSGMLALQLVFAPVDRNGAFFSHSIETGSHIASMDAVRNGEADICAVDCVTAALCRKHRPSALSGLVEVARSLLVPGLPFVTRTYRPAPIVEAFKSLIADKKTAHIRDALMLRDLSVLPDDAYSVISKLESTL